MAGSTDWEDLMNGVFGPGGRFRGGAGAEKRPAVRTLPPPRKSWKKRRAAPRLPPKRPGAPVERAFCRTARS